MILVQIKRLCKENGVSVYRLEHDVGLSNGTIGGWDKADPGAKKLKAVADYFGVTVDELLRDEQNEQGA